MRIIVLMLTMTAGVFTATAQFLPPLQAETADEYDTYLDVVDAATPEQTVQHANRFERSWSKSSLLAHVFQLQFEALVKLGKTPEAIAAANRALSLAPGNLTVRAGLSVILANEARTSQQLREAEKEARFTLTQLESFRPPKSLPFPRWRQVEKRVNSQAHTALGLVAFKDNLAAEAVKEFETAVSLVPEPATQLRLARLYRHLGDLENARKWFRAASAGDDPAVRALAEQELKD